MSIPTNKEKLDAQNGLCCLIQALVGKRLSIDLQNESSITGKIIEVDGYMNISLENVVMEHYDGTLQEHETMYVKGRNIRYVHIPKQMSVKETIAKLLKKSNSSENRPKTALQRHQENKRREKQDETRRLIETMKQKEIERPSTSGKA